MMEPPDAIKLKYLKFRKLPLYIQIELSGICNSNCEYCDWTTRPKDQMIYLDTELAKKAVRESIDIGAFQISFHVTGESLLHPDFLKIIPDNYNILVSTNCLLLEGEIAEKLSKMKKLAIILSPPWDQDNIRKRGVANALQYMEMNPENRLVVMQMITSRNSIPQSNYMFQSFSKYLVRPNFQIHYKQPYTQILGKPIDGYIPVIDPIPGKVFVDCMSTPQSCGNDCLAFPPNPATSILIQSDGQIKPCFYRWAGWKSLFGNIRDTTLMQFWKSDELAEFRRTWCRGDPNAKYTCHDCIRMAYPRDDVWYGPKGSGIPPTELNQEQRYRANEDNPYQKFW